MSTYEKIASVLLVILLALIVVLWYAEERHEGAYGGAAKPSGFDESTGQDFRIGPFTNLSDEQVSGGTEQGCEALQPVFVAALHDIDVHLAAQAASIGVPGNWSEFEVNASALSALCNKNAQLTLRDADQDTLLLQKLPFSRAVPPGGTPDDVGTVVTLEATVTRAGEGAPPQPQASARVLIPDRFLGIATSSTP